MWRIEYLFMCEPMELGSTQSTDDRTVCRKRVLFQRSPVCSHVRAIGCGAVEPQQQESSFHLSLVSSTLSTASNTAHHILVFKYYTQFDIVILERLDI